MRAKLFAFPVVQMYNTGVRTNYREVRHPMIIDGQALKTASAGNIQSCGPKRVRRAIEMCLAHLPAGILKERGVTAFDPLCGNGVIPTELQAHFSDAVNSILACDINAAAVGVTHANLAFFQANGVPSNVFRHNVLQPFPAETVPDKSVRMVLTDPPYGAKCHWQDDHGKLSDDPEAAQGFLRTMFENLGPKMADESVIGILSGARLRIEESIGSFTHAEVYEIPGFTLSDTRRLHVMKPA